MDLDTARLALVDGAAVTAGGYQLLLGAAFAGTQFAVSRILMLGDDGHWMLHDIPSKVVSVAACPERLQLFAIGWDGFVSVAASGGLMEEQIPDAGTGRGKLGYVSQVRCIQGSAWACGDLCQVYRRDNGAWRHIDDGLPVQDVRSVGNGLNAIDGTETSDIYAAGDRGRLFHYDGRSWSQVDLPTNVSLERIVCVSSDEVYICGKHGILLRGSQATWDVLGDPDAFSEDFWGMARFQGQVFLATSNHIVRLAGAEFEVVDTGIPRVGSYNRLTASPTALWSVGVNQLLRFDGVRWTDVPFPQNQ